MNILPPNSAIVSGVLAAISPRRGHKSDLVGDLLAALAAWFLLLIVDLYIGLLAGFPLALLGVYLRRRWWSRAVVDPAPSSPGSREPGTAEGDSASGATADPAPGKAGDSVPGAAAEPAPGGARTRSLVEGWSSLWSRSLPLRGRIALVFLLPLLGLYLSGLSIQACWSPLLGVLAAAMLLVAVEAATRRLDSSFIRSSPILSALALLGASAVFGFILLEFGLGRWPSEDFLKVVSPPPDPPTWSRRAKEQAVGAVRAVMRRNGAGAAAASGSAQAVPLSDADAPTDSPVAKLAAELAPQMPELLAAKSPEGVYVTLFRDDGHRSRGFGSGGPSSLVRVLQAAALALQLPAHRPVRTDRAPRKPALPARRHVQDPQREPYAWIQVDVAGKSRDTVYRPLFHVLAPLLRSAHWSLERIEPLGSLFSLAYDVETGVDGLRVSKRGQRATAVMLPAEPVTYGWLTPRVRSAPAKLRAMLSHTWFREIGRSLALTQVELDVDKFRTTSFGAPFEGKGVVDWHRGNALVGDLDRQTLVRRTALAVDWLSRQVLRPASNQPSGRFHYEVHPPYEKGTAGYNLPRHAGSVYGLLAFFREAHRLDEPAFREPALRALEAALSGMAYIARHLRRPSSGDSGELCFSEQGADATSGATALAAMALAELPKASQVTERQLNARIALMPAPRWLRGLGSCMLRMVDAEGAVFRSYREARAHRLVIKEPLYFPGEVMLALVRAYRILGEERFLKGARKIGDRQLRKYRWYLALNLPRRGDHWIIQALSELAQVTKERQYAELSVLMARGYLREQYPTVVHVHPDYRGAYYRVADLPRTTRAASRGEALGGAVAAARLLGQDPSDLEEGLIRGARHLIEQQLLPQNSYFVPREFDVRGAIRMGLVDNHCRIDNNQHGLVALLHALRAMDNRPRH